MPTPVYFEASRVLPYSADAVFAELIDWRGHAEWVPLTRVEVTVGDGGAGTEFIATSGVGPAALPDRMRVVSLDDETRTAVIEKLGPMLTGTVILRVIPVTEWTSRVEWIEDIAVRGLPRFLASVTARAARLAFERSLAAMARHMRKRGVTDLPA